MALCGYDTQHTNADVHTINTNPLSCLGILRVNGPTDDVYIHTLTNTHTHTHTHSLSLSLSLSLTHTQEICASADRRMRTSGYTGYSTSAAYTASVTPASAVTRAFNDPDPRYKLFTTSTPVHLWTLIHRQRERTRESTRA